MNGAGAADDGMEVVDNAARNRFETGGGTSPAVLTYERDAARLVLVHTVVPDRLGGKGFGGRLVEAAVDAAASGGLVLVPVCPFARSWLGRHPEVADRVTIEWPAP